MSELITVDWLDEQEKIYSTPKAKSIFRVLRKSYELWLQRSREPASWPYDEFVRENLDECKLALLTFCQVY